MSAALQESVIFTQERGFNYAHEQNIICSKIPMDSIAHEQTII